MSDKFYKEAIDKLEKFLRSKRTEVMGLYGNIPHETKSHHNDVVTEMDKKLEREIRDLLEGIDPSIKIVGEEYGGEPGGTFWTVDPIDDTQAFIRGLPYCSTMISLIVDDKPVLGVVYNFALDNFYFAIDGKGAYCDGKVIHVSDRPIKKAYVRTHVNRKLINLLMDQGVFRVHLSGFVVDVARGAVDGYITNGEMGEVWDYVPRAVIIREAGGVVTNFGKDTYDWRDRSIVASAPTIHDQLNSLADNL
ncbi:MAG: inositol monophosphatase [Patescibacteria group bacterium]